jgi:hypothetical protein
MVSLVATLLTFVIQLIISTVIIFVVTKVMGEKEGIITAVLAAFIGTLIYSAAYFVLGTGWIAAIIGGIIWLLALQYLYTIGWLKSLAIAVLVWIVALIIGIFLPTVTGPL